jgi:hypothetical protein
MRIERYIERGAARDRCPSERDERLPVGTLDRFECEVDRVSALVHDVIGRLSRHHPGYAIGEAASEDPQQMRPRFEVALTALAEIERRRELTQKEVSYRRAFKMLVEVTRRG